VGGKVDGKNNPCYYNKENKIVLCEKVYNNDTNKRPENQNNVEYLGTYGFYDIKLSSYRPDLSIDKYVKTNWDELAKSPGRCRDNQRGDKIYLFEKSESCTPENTYYQIDFAMEGGEKRMAMIVIPPSMARGSGKDAWWLTGMTKESFNEHRGDFGNDIRGRNADGSENSDKSFYEKDGALAFGTERFVPLTIDSSDGDAVDFTNKARLKGTAIGGAVGGGLGALSAYQGAQSEIQERLIVEIQEYEGSLRGFYCMSGGRWGSFYNDTVIVPGMK
jgi:hypothetical protein